MTEAPHDPDHVREWIKNDLEATARWRFDKAAEYPNDARNKDAALRLETLVATIPSIQPAILESLYRTFRANPDIQDEWNTRLRFVGFKSFFPNSAEEFIRDFLDSLLIEVERPALGIVQDDD